MDDTAAIGGALIATPQSAEEQQAEFGVSIADVEAARDRIAPFIRRTPLLPTRTLGDTTH